MKAARNTGARSTVLRTLAVSSALCVELVWSPEGLGLTLLHRTSREKFCTETALPASVLQKQHASEYRKLGSFQSKEVDKAMLTIASRELPKVFAGPKYFVGRAQTAELTDARIVALSKVVGLVVFSSHTSAPCEGLVVMTDRELTEEQRAELQVIPA